ncbi:methyl-accepting chemotaxis protein [Thermomicrobium sp.]
MVGFIARLRLSYQMGLMVLVFLAGFALSTIVSMSGLRQVMVNSPLYRQIARDQELIADILPPPAYIVDAYANVLQLKLAVENGADQQTIQRLLTDSQRTRQKYEERLSYWRSVLPEGEIREQLTERAADPALEFFDIRDRQVIPALLAGETARANELIWNELRPRFEAHRRAIDRTVELGYAAVTRSEQHAESVVTRVNVLVPAVSLISALVASLLATMVARLLTKRLGHVAKALDELTTHDIPTLERALGALAHGDLRASVSFTTRPLELTGRDEVATLIGAYNRLQSALHSVEQSFRSLVEGLRDMVTSLRGAATLLNDVGADVHRRVEQTSVAIQSATGAAERVARGSADQAYALTGLRQSLTELAQTSDALAKAAADQARVVHRAFELASEITGRNQEAAQTARAVGQLATEHAQHAQQGQRAVERTLSAMTRAQAKSTEAQKRVDEMVKHAQSIDQVLTIVRSITEQTNLLALNAAIEAARAGEAGRGFAVVAEEVRKLSASAAESTTHIAELVHQLQNSAASAVQAATESLEAMTGVVNETNTVSDLFESTAEAARELATLSERALTLAEQALKSVEHLRAQLERAASTVEETSAGTAELATSVATISATASQLSAIGEENAHASEHASNAMDEISRELSEVARHAQELFQLAQQLLHETERFQLAEETSSGSTAPSRGWKSGNGLPTLGNGFVAPPVASRWD